MKYIDAEKLKAEIERLKEPYHPYLSEFESGCKEGRNNALDDILFFITHIQQDKDTLELCSKIWWEEQGWIMIPPDATIEGIDSLLRQVRKKFQQEQPNDVCAEIKEYYGEELAFEDERTKAAYHFFSAGKAFELREYEEERKKHITDLLDNFQKGMNAGYEKAISELKEGKVECSPVMKELIDKLFGIGNTFNFGFGPTNFQQELPESSNGKFVFPKYLYARTTNNKTIDVAYGPQSLNAVEYIREDALLECLEAIKVQSLELKEKGYGDVFYGAQIAILEEVINKLNQM